MTAADSDREADRRLLERVRQGDGEALGIAWERIEGASSRRASRNLGPGLRGKANASDILQDAFLEVLRTASSFRGDTMAEFASWVGQIIESCARQRHRSLRAAKRHAPSSPSGLRALFEARRPAPASPSAPVRATEDRTRFEDALAALGADQRAVVEALAIEGRPVDEVARDLGRSPAAIYSLLARARAALALRLEGDDTRSSPC